MERAGFEPAASGLQTHPIARPDLTPTDRIGMTESKSAILATGIRTRSTAVCSHRRFLIGQRPGAQGSSGWQDEIASREPPADRAVLAVELVRQRNELQRSSVGHGERPLVDERVEGFKRVAPAWLSGRATPATAAERVVSVVSICAPWSMFRPAPTGRRRT